MVVSVSLLSSYHWSLRYGISLYRRGGNAIIKVAAINENVTLANRLLMLIKFFDFRWDLLFGVLNFGLFFVFINFCDSFFVHAGLLIMRVSKMETSTNVCKIDNADKCSHILA